MSIEFGTVVICKGCGCFGPGAHHEDDAVKAALAHAGWFSSEDGGSLYCAEHAARATDRNVEPEPVMNAEPNDTEPAPPAEGFDDDEPHTNPDRGTVPAE